MKIWKSSSLNWVEVQPQLDEAREWCDHALHTEACSQKARSMSWSTSYCSCGLDAVMTIVDAMQRVVDDEEFVLVTELRQIAAHIRTPGNINPDDAIDECARVLENRARDLEG